MSGGMRGTSTARHATRRAVMMTGLAVGLGAAGGCQLRVGQPATATRAAPITAGPTVEGLAVDCAALGELAASVVGGAAAWSAQLAPLHRHQAQVLATLVQSPSPTVTPTRGSGSDLRPAELRALGWIEHLATGPSTTAPTVAATLAQRWAAVALLGGTVPAGVATASTPWSDTSAVLSLLAATRAAYYGFQVVAAQSALPGREQAQTTLDVLTRLADEQTRRCGGEVPSPPLGYALPYAVTTPAQAATVATLLATRLRASYGAALTQVTAGVREFTDLVGWLGAAEALVGRWGGALAAFPGMS